MRLVSPFVASILVLAAAIASADPPKLSRRGPQGAAELDLQTRW